MLNSTLHSRRSISLNQPPVTNQAGGAAFGPRAHGTASLSGGEGRGGRRGKGEEKKQSWSLTLITFGSVVNHLQPITHNPSPHPVTQAGGAAASATLPPSASLTDRLREGGRPAQPTDGGGRRIWRLLSETRGRQACSHCSVPGLGSFPVQAPAGRALTLCESGT